MWAETSTAVTRALKQHGFFVMRRRRVGPNDCDVFSRRDESHDARLFVHRRCGRRRFCAGNCPANVQSLAWPTIVDVVVVVEEWQIVQIFRSGGDRRRRVAFPLPPCSRRLLAVELRRSIAPLQARYRRRLRLERRTFVPDGREIRRRYLVCGVRSNFGRRCRQSGRRKSLLLAARVRLGVPLASGSAKTSKERE